MWLFWCNSEQVNPFEPSVTHFLKYLSALYNKGRTYSCINLHKSAICQTLAILGNNTFMNCQLITRFMKGIFNLRPPLCRYIFTWDVGIVLKFLSNLFPLKKLTLKWLTLKCVALVALASAQRSQTLAILDRNLMLFDRNVVKFKVGSLLKTSRPQHTDKSIIIYSYHKESLCPVKTLKHYLDRTNSKCKDTRVFVSFKTFSTVTSCTIARWLKTVLSYAGIDISKFKAHSFRSASTSAAIKAGLPLKEVLKTADWSSAKTFHKFYYKETVESTGAQDRSGNFTDKVFNSSSQSQH